ncbi:MAG: hypothetical protein HY287_01555 [Planctomycetes bacterium]|nr:hypothetical protein [Planctomycetota bacterium]
MNLPPTEKCARRSAWQGVILLAPIVVLSAWLTSIARGVTTDFLLRWVALVPLFIAIRILPRSPAAVCGGLWGCFIYLFVFRHSVSGMNVSHWALLTAAPALFAGVASTVIRRFGFYPLLIGLGWVGLELALRPLALRYGLLLSSQGDSHLMHTFGQIGGYLFVAFLFAVINAIVVGALTQACSAIPRSLHTTIPIGPGWVLIGPSVLSLFECDFRRSQPRAPPA